MIAFCFFKCSWAEQSGVPLLWAFPASSPRVKICPRNSPLQKEHTAPSPPFSTCRNNSADVPSPEAKGVLDVLNVRLPQDYSPFTFSNAVSHLKKGTWNGQIWVQDRKEGERDPAAADIEQDHRAAQWDPSEPPAGLG